MGECVQFPPIFEAIARNDEASVAKYIADDEASLATSWGSYDFKPLHFAVITRSNLVLQLVHAGAAVNEELRGSRMGVTPLYLAAEQGDVNIMRILVNNGASVSVVTSNGVNVLHVCAMNRHLEAVRYLLSLPESSILCTQADYNGFTPIHFALLAGSVECSDELLPVSGTLDLPSLVKAAFSNADFSFVRPQTLSDNEIKDIAAVLHWLSQQFGGTAEFLDTITQPDIVRLIFDSPQPISGLRELKEILGEEVFGDLLHHMPTADILMRLPDTAAALETASWLRDMGLLSGNKPLSTAIESGTRDPVAAVAYFSDTTAQDLFGALCAALSAGNLAVADRIYQLYHDSRSVCTGDGDTILSAAVRGGVLPDVSRWEGALDSLEIEVPMSGEDTGTVLLLAAELGHTGDIQCLLQAGANAKVKTRNGRDLVECAATTCSGARGSSDSALAFVEQYMGLPLSGTPQSFWDALKRDDRTQISVHLAQDRMFASCTQPASLAQVVPLHIAASRDVELVQQLLRAGAQANFRPSLESAEASGFDLTPAAMAALTGHDDILRLLIKRGVPATITGSVTERTLLHYACIGGYTECLRVIFDAAPELHTFYGQIDSEGHSPLYLALAHGHLDCAEALVAHFAKSTEYWLVEEDESSSSLPWAIVNGQPDRGAGCVAAMLRWYLGLRCWNGVGGRKKLKAQLKRRETGEMTVLHAAARLDAGVADTVSQLVHTMSGAGDKRSKLINAADQDGWTPLMYLALSMSDSADVQKGAAALLHAHASIDISDASQQNCLHHYAGLSQGSNSVELLKTISSAASKSLLVKLLSQRSDAASGARTPFECAIAARNTAAAQLLHELGSPRPRCPVHLVLNTVQAEDSTVDTSCLQWILQKSEYTSEIDAKNQTGWSPLLVCALAGLPRQAELLIAHGANCEFVAADGLSLQTILQTATMSSASDSLTIAQKEISQLVYQHNNNEQKPLTCSGQVLNRRLLPSSR